ncbi:MAG: protein kinase [Bacteroidales bacterium]|nr:protein kinase [Bacteroidales bacterium]
MESTPQIKQLAVGTTLYGGKYVIERVIGEGGFGITYFARHTVLTHQCYAIKEFFISGKCARDTQHHTLSLVDMSAEDFQRFRSRFVDEARTLSTLEHVGIVKVVDIFDDNNTSYIVMPFIEGETLQKKVEKNGKLPYDVAVNYIAQLSEAIAYIHSKHILHRDIKPDNVMITPDNRVVLIDFGSARQFVNDEVQRQTAILTQGYAPPEQYVATSRKGNYTDIYALGAVLYYAVTGRKPIDSAGRSIERMPEPIELTPGLPYDANRTIMKAMQLRPEERHQSAEEFMNDLLGRTVPSNNVVNGHDTPPSYVSPSTSQIPQSGMPKQKAPFSVAALVVGIVSMVYLFILLLAAEDADEEILGFFGVLGIALSIVGVVFSSIGWSKVKANRSAYTNVPPLVVGKVLSIVSMVIWAVITFVGLIMILEEL